MAGLKERILKKLEEAQKKNKEKLEELKRKKEESKRGGKEKNNEPQKGLFAALNESVQNDPEYQRKKKEIQERREHRLKKYEEERKKILRKQVPENRERIRKAVRSGQLYATPGLAPKDMTFTYCIKKGLSDGWGTIKCGILLFVLCLVFAIVPIIGLVALPGMFFSLLMICYGLFVVPFATLLHESVRASDLRIKELIEEERKKEAEEKGVEYLTMEEEFRVQNEIRKEDAKRRQLEMAEELAEQVRNKKNEGEGKNPETTPEKKKKPDSFSNMKVDMGDGKKVKFTELPKHLQEQLLKEYAGEEATE
jgi:hypothetical protein